VRAGTLALVAALALGARLSAAQGLPALAPAPPVPGDTGIAVVLITYGSGPVVWERFGHNALWLHDPRTGLDVAYQWGLFDFAQPRFLQRFLTGDTKYSMGAENPRAMIDYYRRAGRPITLQRLALTSAQAERLRADLEHNAREENRYYRYDYFQDNCSTRLRDALDAALDGAIRRAVGDATTSTSFRRESVRLTDGDRPVQLGIDLALGRPADRPLTVWQSFFVPMRLRDAVRDVRVPAGPGGAMLPLVREEREVQLARDPVVVERVTSPRLAWRYAATGLLLAAIVGVLRVMMVSRRGAAWGLALFGAAWWLVCGIVGVLIALAWTATRHVFWVGNENLLLLTPLCLALAVLTPAALLRRKAVRPARIVAKGVAALALVAAMLALLPGGQENRAIVALFLPVHLALVAALVLPDRARPAGTT
jgi:hypothetical protein